MQRRRYAYTRAAGVFVAAGMLAGGLGFGADVGLAGVRAARSNENEAYVYPSGPSNAAPPSIAGEPAAGETLTGSHGSWTDSPTSYADTWEDCDASGRNCVNTGFTGLRYLLSSSDVGHTIVLSETATNLVGTSAPALSAPTAVVVAASTPTTVATTGTTATTTTTTTTATTATTGTTSHPTVALRSAKVSGSTVTLSLACPAAASQACKVSIVLSIVETVKRGRVIAIRPARSAPVTTHKTIVVGRATVTIGAGHTKTVKVKLNSAGRKLVKSARKLRAKLSLSRGRTVTTTKTVTFTSRQ